MNNYLKGFLVSLAVHSLLFGSFFAFASNMEPHRGLLFVDLSLVSTGGSGSGNLDGAGGGGADAEAGPPGQLEDAQKQEAPREEEPPADTAAVEEDAKPEAPEPELAPPPEIVKAEVEPEPVPEVAKPEERIPPKPKKELVKPEKKPRKQKAVPAGPVESVKPPVQKAQAGKARNQPPGPAVQGKENATYGKGGGNSGGSGGGKSGGTGGGGSSGYIKSNFGYIQRYIRRHLEYPRQARMMNQTGVTHYSFVVEKSGRVSSVRITKSSGFPLLDKAGAKAINAASPLPAPPEPAHISMPIVFTLN